jgi:chromosome segregation ATPase
MLINRVTCLLLHNFFLLISLADLRPSLFAVLANDFKAAQKALSDEKSIRLGVENSLTEEKASRQAAEQSLQQSKDTNATLALELENGQTSLAATCDKSDSKSKVLDLQVFRADEAMLRLKNVESRLKAIEEDLKNQRQLLESA